MWLAVCGATRSLPARARDTVAVETPATEATSFNVIAILVLSVWNRGQSHYNAGACHIIRRGASLDKPLLHPIGGVEETRDRAPRRNQLITCRPQFIAQFQL